MGHYIRGIGFFAWISFLFLVIAVQSCNPGIETATPMFVKKDPTTTGIQFTNQLKPETEALFVKEYRYMFNGGGVGLGDFNNDGSMDVLLSSNENGIRLYLNKGNWQFDDITADAGIEAGGWLTGIALTDVNADGWLDIYVCRSFDTNVTKRQNLLFINQGDLTFQEKAQTHGLDDGGFSTQAAFFDYDGDGLLDCYVMNHPDRWFMQLPLRYPNDSRSFANQDNLYRNQGNGTFRNVSREAGLLHEDFGGYGLGLAIGDLDQDNDPDIYVANDYESPDFLYINQGDGTFREELKDRIGHTSMYSMGADIADFNNDGLLDIYVADMAAEGHFRSKTQMRPMQPKRFEELINMGLPHQYMYNSLQLNRGDGHFSETAMMMGVAKTDWSWSPLFADVDLDGFKDLLVTNGFRVDDMDNDYWAGAQQKYGRKLIEEKSNELALAMLNEMPSTPLANYIYRNAGGRHFTNASSAWGLTEKGFSQGAAYGDLDGDGDLDLVINNLNQMVSVYENRTTSDGHKLVIALTGPETNPFGIGTNLKIVSGSGIQMQEVQATHGYQSSSIGTYHFGFSREDDIHWLIVTWPNGQQDSIPGDQVRERMTIVYRPDLPFRSQPKTKMPLLTPLDMQSYGMDFVHTENNFDDYRTEVLLPYKMSMLGPASATGDVNGDLLDDFFIGGAMNQPARLYIRQPNGQFELRQQPWDDDRGFEDVGALFIDVDSDGDLDLYVASGGNESQASLEGLAHRLYLNDGTGRFDRLEDANLPAVSGMALCAADYDGDGDTDLFVGGRQVPGNYPMPASSVLLINENGQLVDHTANLAPDFIDLGMVTDAIWVDLNEDDQLDLMVVGEWMAPRVYLQNNGALKRQSFPELDSLVGWWNSIIAEDFDQDGDVDFVMGNLGLNYKYHAGHDSPFHVYAADFDQSGTTDIILSYYQDDTLYPLRGKDCSTQQMPVLQERFRSYKEYALASLQDIYGTQLEGALHYEATTFASIYVQNEGQGHFTISELPLEAQLSSVHDMLPVDINRDGLLDLILVGNLFQAEIETPRNDASLGLVLLGNGQGSFESLSPNVSGLWSRKDAKAIHLLMDASGVEHVLIANNNDRPDLYAVQTQITKK